MNNFKKVRWIVTILFATFSLYIFFVYAPKYNEKQREKDARHIAKELVSYYKDLIKETKIVKNKDGSVDLEVYIVGVHKEVIEVSLNEIQPTDKEIKLKFFYEKNMQ